MDYEFNEKVGCKRNLKVEGGYWFFLDDGSGYDNDTRTNLYLGDSCGQPSSGHRKRPLVKLCKECSKDARGVLVRAGLIW